MSTIYLYSLVILVVGVILKLFLGRSVFTKHKYIRVEQYNDDMSVSIKYIKRSNFNQDHSILINPKHVFYYNGYITVILTSNSAESINPIDFESKYNVEDFKSAMKSKLIHETFVGLKAEKFDKITLLLLLNGITLIAVAYLLYNVLGSK